ncbi:MAG: 5-oxoprolinase/urea amidolyase family protein [Sulfobacillus sp.]|nr:5-oxoprolinase/urea amidolyase family protein [Sulfobacillus sp.]
MVSVRVVRPGLMTSVQDPGRWGYEHLGVAVAGVLDDYAAGWANRLLDNPPDAAVLELTISGPELVVESSGYLALAGADLSASIDGRPWNPGEVQRVETGETIRFGARRRGARAYMAFPGGIDVPPVLGSRATDVLLGIGGVEGRPLRGGDVVTARGSGGAPRTAGWETCLHRRRLRVLPGVRRDRFPPEAWAKLVTGEFRVSLHSDAMGLRLSGPPIPSVPGDAISEGMAIGAIECPPSGELLVLMKNRGTLGGYPALAHVIRADWPALAQLVPGELVFFDPVTPEAAYTAWRQQQSWIEHGAALPQDIPIRAPIAGGVDGNDGEGRLLSAPGDVVAAGQPILDIISLGQRITVTSPVFGVLLDIVRNGSWVEAGDEIATIRGWDDGGAN